MGTLWGPSWQELHVVGLVGDEVVAEQRFPAHNDATHIAVTIDDTELHADGADMTRLVISHTDEYGNVQAHSRAAVLIGVDGPATLIGPSPLALAGGVGAVFLRANDTPGRVTVTVRAPEFGEERTVKVKIR
ncbi:MAG: Beta-galactosidase [bacterium ADurb.Bin429]|nr:MAG: Beta-galactosidase [bacterium ADurb.Bin429]